MKITSAPHRVLRTLGKAPTPPPEPPDQPKDKVEWSKVGRGAINGAAVMTLASGAAKLTNMAGFTFMANIGLTEAVVGITAGALIGGYMVVAGMKGSLPGE